MSNEPIKARRRVIQNPNPACWTNLPRVNANLSQEWAEPREAWLTLRYVARDASPLTIEMRRYRLMSLERESGGKGPWDLSEDDLTMWINSKPRGGSTRITMLSTVRSFYGWAVERGYMETDITARIPRPRTPQPRPKPVPDEVYEDLLARVMEPEVRAALRLSGELGLRRAEVAGFRRDHLFRDGEGWWLRFVGKGNKERQIPCSDSIAQELAEIFENQASPYLFPASHPRGHLSPHYVSTIVSRLLPEGYTMHKLRHRAGTVVYRKTGGDIYLAAKMLGHASVSTTAAYVAPNMANLRKALDD